jgi:hypothetical protein
MNAKISSESLINTAVNIICDRSLTEGGFAIVDGGSYRPDATAWSILALEASRIKLHLMENACKRLTESQLSDGRVPITSDCPTSFWPTPLAILAWKKVGGFE